MKAIFFVVFNGYFSKYVHQYIEILNSIYDYLSNNNYHYIKIIIFI